VLYYLATQSLSKLAAKGEQRVESRRLSNNSLRIAAEHLLENVSENEIIEKEKKQRTVVQVPIRIRRHTFAPLVLLERWI
jgi:hypothetical protein